MIISLFLSLVLSLVASLTLFSSSAKGGQKDETCFNFDTRVTSPLRTPSQSFSKKDDFSASGNLPKEKGGIWGSLGGRVERPIQDLYTQLLDHYTIKDEKKVRLNVYEQERAGYSDFHVVMVKAITPLVDVKWEENWAYLVKEGTRENPKEVVISYQKTTGSKFIPHLCGSIVLKAVTPKQTDVYFYEEVNAFGKRSAQDTVLGHKGTLANLRQISRIPASAH